MAREKEEREMNKLVKAEEEKERRRNMKYALRTVKAQGPRDDDDDKDYVPE